MPAHNPFDLVGQLPGLRAIALRTCSQSCQTGVSRIGGGSLLPSNALQRAHVRSLLAWVQFDFRADVTAATFARYQHCQVAACTGVNREIMSRPPVQEWMQEAESLLPVPLDE